MGYVIITGKRTFPIFEEAKMHALAELLALNLKEKWITKEFKPTIWADGKVGIPSRYIDENSQKIVDTFCAGGRVENNGNRYYREYGYAIYEENNQYGYLVWLYSCAD